jgi:hypothetical protein
VRIFAVALGGNEVTGVTLFTRPTGAAKWEARAMKLVGRRTYEAELKAPETVSPLLDYYVEMGFHSSPLESFATAPLEAPARFYTLTLI